MPRPIQHFTYSQQEKFEKFRAAYSKLNNYVKSKEYLAAHVLAFSILEDRVLAARIQCGELNNSPVDKRADINKIPFERSLTRLFEWGVIEESLYKSAIKCGVERNEFIHQAMWRLDEFNYSSIVQLRKTINTIESCRKKYVRKLEKMGSNKQPS